MSTQHFAHILIERTKQIKLQCYLLIKFVIYVLFNQNHAQHNKQYNFIRF